MAHTFGEQELADYLFDRIIVNCPTCLDTKCLRVACLKVAEELLEDAEIVLQAGACFRRRGVSRKRE